MIWVVRLVALLLELVGLFFTVEHIHKEEYTAALILLVFDTVMVIVFVLSHCLVEEVIDRHERKKRLRW